MTFRIALEDQGEITDRTRTTSRAEKNPEAEKPPPIPETAYPTGITITTKQRQKQIRPQRRISGLWSPNLRALFLVILVTSLLYADLFRGVSAAPLPSQGIPRSTSAIGGELIRRAGTACPAQLLSTSLQVSYDTLRGSAGFTTTASLTFTLLTFLPSNSSPATWMLGPVGKPADSACRAAASATSLPSTNGCQGYQFTWTVPYYKLQTCKWTLRSNDSRVVEYTNAISLEFDSAGTLSNSINVVVPRAAEIPGQYLLNDADVVEHVPSLKANVAELSPEPPAKTATPTSKPTDVAAVPTPFPTLTATSPPEVTSSPKQGGSGGIAVQIPAVVGADQQQQGQEATAAVETATPRTLAASITGEATTLPTSTP